MVVEQTKRVRSANNRGGARPSNGRNAFLASARACLFALAGLIIAFGQTVHAELLPTLPFGYSIEDVAVVTDFDIGADVQANESRTFASVSELGDEVARRNITAWFAFSAFGARFTADLRYPEGVFTDDCTVTRYGVDGIHEEACGRHVYTGRIRESGADVTAAIYAGELRAIIHESDATYVVEPARGTGDQEALSRETPRLVVHKLNHPPAPALVPRNAITNGVANRLLRVILFADGAFTQREKTVCAPHLGGCVALAPFTLQIIAAEIARSTDLSLAAFGAGVIVRVGHIAFVDKGARNPPPLPTPLPNNINSFLTEIARYKQFIGLNDPRKPALL